MAPLHSSLWIKRAQQPAAFSLVELLVVLTIVGTLCAMLMPAIGQAREVARRVVCVSNYHQIGVGANAYGADHRDEIPYLNDGGYAELGKGGPYGQSWDSVATVQSRIKSDPLAIFARAYLNSTFTIGSTSASNKAALPPKSMICPGIKPDAMVMALPPGATSPSTTVPLGNTVLGFGSFLGESTGGTPGTAMVNGVLNMKYRYCDSTTGVFARLRFSDFRNPSDDVIFLDIQNQRTSLTSLWMVTHGRGGRPDGTVQGAADFSVQFVPYARLNVYYTPGYNWDREVRTPYYASPRAQLNRGGYPTPNTGNGSLPVPPRNWYGIGTFFHMATFTP